MPTNLTRHRVRFEIDQTTHITVLGAQLLCPTEIEQHLLRGTGSANRRSHGLHSTWWTRQEAGRSAVV